jgi:hypothetical protein
MLLQRVHNGLEERELRVLVLGPGVVELKFDIVSFNHGKVKTDSNQIFMEKLKVVSKAGQ